MTRREELFKGKSHEEVANHMSQLQPGTESEMAPKAEFLLRQTKLQEEATNAAKETAEYTKRYVRYMFWSVVFIAISALATLIVALSGK